MRVGPQPHRVDLVIRLYSIQVSITSWVKTPPSSSHWWSALEVSSTCSSEPGTCLTIAFSSGGRSYRSLSMGSGGSILFLMPSRPAISIALNARYGLQVGSGVRNSSRLAAGLFENSGMRMQALRFRWLYTRLIGAS